MPNPSWIAPLSRRHQVLICASIAAATAIAWGYLLHLHHQMSSAIEYDKAMAAMGMAVNTPWTLADGGFTLAMWVIMMAGMMIPAAAPVIILFAGIENKRAQCSALLRTALFALGYITVWSGFSAAATSAQWILHQALLLSPSAAVSNKYLAGGILMGAGLYQLTNWKSKCLAHCRSPLGFIMTHWHEGRLGTFRMGLSHGAYCLGCCWALMCMLFAVGVMSLLWVAALSIFVFLEKTGPSATVIARLAAAGLITSGMIEIALRG